MLSDKVPGRGTHIPPQVKPPPAPRQWKTICAAVGAIIMLIPATNTELQHLIGVPPSITFMLGLLVGGVLGATVGRAIDKKMEHKRFLERHPEFMEREK